GQALRVVRVDDLGGDRDLDDLAGPARLHLDHPAADPRLDHLLGELVLSLRHLFLHLLHLLEHLVHVHLRHSSTSRASNVVFMREMMSSSCAASSASASPASASPSPTANASASLWPVTSYRTSARSVAFFGSSARLRWKEAAGGNSITSRLPESSIGFASPRTDAVGIERSPIAGNTAWPQTCCTCSMSRSGSGSEGASVAAGSAWARFSGARRAWVGSPPRLSPPRAA